jgi:hypothetical protein
MLNLPARVFCRRPPPGPPGADASSCSPASFRPARRAPRRPHAEPAPRGAGGAAAPPLVGSPAVAQRELLRRFYLVADPAEQLQVLSEFAPHLEMDFDTALHLLSHAAQQAGKGVMRGDPAGRPALARALVASSLAPALPALGPAALGAVLWTLASFEGAHGPWSEALLEEAASRELAAARWRQYSTKELASLVYAAGRLSAQPPPPAAAKYAGALVAELVKRMEQLPYVKGSLTVADCTDLVASCAAIYAAGGGGGAAGQAPAVPPAVAQLLDAIAGEVRHQLANKHSLRSPFSPRDLARFLGAYAALGARGGATPGMLDAVAGFVAARVRSRDLNAVSRPADLAAVLGAFAELRHATVAVPELLAAAGAQLRRRAAAGQEVAVAGAAAAGAPDASLPVCDLAAVLRAHCRLGFRPDDLTLHAVAAGLRRELPAARPADAAALLEVLAELEYSPGARALGLLLSRAADEDDDEEDGRGDDAGAERARRIASARAHAEQLGHAG